MEVSAPYCSTSFKYGSYNESDDVTMMMEDDVCQYGSFNSRNESYYGERSGSCGEEEEDDSSCDGVDVQEAGVSYFEVDDASMSSEDEDDDDEDDDEDNDEWTNQKNPLAQKKNSIAYYAAMEMLRIRFPFQSISIRISDFCCLQEKDLLNDTMIDFYLNHIVEHVLPDNLGRKVTVLPSVFWHNLSLRQHAIDDDEEKNLTEDQRLELKFKDLHEFVEDFDLHDVDFIVVPVNEWEHWSLAIICHPFTERAQTAIFDSQLNADLNNLENMAGLIDSFLRYSWKKRTGTWPREQLPCIVPRGLPQQTNNFDCGVFIVEFARRFLLAPPRKLDVGFDFGVEYADFSVAGKRVEMQRAVLSLCNNPSQWRPLVDCLNGINTAVPHRAL